MMSQLLSLKIDPDRTAEEIINFIKKTVRGAGFSRAVIGLSGGIDSSTVCALAVKALGARNIIGAVMPFGNRNREAINDVNALTGILNIPAENILKIDIKPFCEPIFLKLGEKDLLRKGNIMVRIRMVILYDTAKKFKALVMGTENKTEYLLGYYTRFGDEASDLEPIRGIYKTQVRQLAKYLELPKNIIQKTPTAGMWKGQTDEGEFGFSYEEADRILFLHTEEGLKENEIVKKGFEEEDVKKVLKRMRENEFKHGLPYLA